MGPTTSANKLDFTPAAAEAQILPGFELRAVGAAFALPSDDGDALGLASIKLSGRCAFALREGFDPIDGSSTGRVVEGGGDAAVTLRKGNTALSLTAGHLGYRAGLDNPLANSAAAAAVVGQGGTAPSLKLTVAREVAEDAFAALSFDIHQRKPELALGWAGNTLTEQASLVVHADPAMRTYSLAASVAFAGVWLQPVSLLHACCHWRPHRLAFKAVSTPDASDC